MNGKIGNHDLTLVLLLIFSLTSSWCQPFAIGHSTINFIDSSRGNRSIATEIYYPADEAGDNVSLTIASMQTFPVLTFGHGFVMTWDAYQNIWEAMVPRGYIMAFPKTEGGISPSHIEFGKDLAFVSTQVFNLGMLQSTIFYNRVSSMNAVMGHSMGGGAAFLAPQFNSNIKSIVTLAAAETSPSAIDAANSIQIPGLVIAGENDCVTPPSTNQLAMYTSLGSACKTYVSINGASHCQMANSNFLCSFGESTCNPQPTITRDQQHLVLEQYLTLWLEAQLKSDCVAGSDFNSLIDTDSRTTFQKNCSQCEPLRNVSIQKENRISLYPNPFSTFLYVGKTGEETYTIKIYDAAARVISSKKIKSNQDFIDTTFLASGIYWYEVMTQNGFTERGKIIKN
ncbi:MAG: T9SS type A sorting domain-containing protein [Flavobacterium sp.]|nr:T9SS type A sorting domain-containing protein [Flavobacterium sp.]